MATNSYRFSLNSSLRSVRVNRSLAFGAIIMVALFAFEIFNYGTTDYALTDLLGELKFAGLRWATILAIAFCGIDFAGIARLFAPELGREENENWFLFGAWLLAATMNAMLTWWGVSLAILNHQTTGDMMIARETMIRIGPVFVAVLVWLIRVMIIGTFSVAGDRLFDSASRQSYLAANHTRPAQAPTAKTSYPSRPPMTQPRSSRPLANDPTILETARRPQRSAVPIPRKTITQLEPTYTDDEEIVHSDPSYAYAPLAARSSNHQNTASIGDAPNPRTPIPRGRS